MSRTPAQHRPAGRLALSLAIGLGSTAITRGQEAAPAPPPPNVLLILVDDLGYGQASCYETGSSYETPSIDRIAARGVRLTDGYAAHCLCLQSRTSILMGMYYQRLGRRSLQALASRSIGRLMKDAGYATACIGKWHNTDSIGEWDGDLANHPSGWGFDEFFGFLGAMHDYFNPALGTGFVGTRPTPFHMPILDGTEPVEKVPYLTAEFTDRSIDFIRRHATRPFFLYLSYSAIHTPLQAPAETVKACGGDKVRAMVRTLDSSVGRLLDTLDELELSRNTLVIFVSDNGADIPADNLPLRAGKRQLYEGGIRVPFLLSWPGHLPEGQVYRQPAMHIDLLPTVLAAAGAPAPEPLDGVDLLPYLTGAAEGPPHEQLMWSHPSRAQIAIRRGPWKLLGEVDDDGQRQAHLFNLDEDLGETTDRSAEQPEILNELGPAMRAWREEVTGQTSPAPTGDH